MSRQASLVLLLVAGFGLYTADVEVASRHVREDGTLSLHAGFGEPDEGASSPVGSRHSLSPALARWAPHRWELALPLAPLEDSRRSSVLGPGWRLGRAPPLPA